MTIQMKKRIEIFIGGYSMEIRNRKWQDIVDAAVYRKREAIMDFDDAVSALREYVTMENEEDEYVRIFAGAMLTCLRNERTLRNTNISLREQIEELKSEQVKGIRKWVLLQTYAEIKDMTPFDAVMEAQRGNIETIDAIIDGKKMKLVEIKGEQDD